MTLLDNVSFATGYKKTEGPMRALFSVARKSNRERARDLLELVGITAQRELMASQVPLGVVKRMEVARALALDPKVLLLDEPLAGLNSKEAGKLADTVVTLNERSLTVVLIEHNLSEVMRVCSRLVVLDNGRKIGDGSPKIVMDDPLVRTAYLGAMENQNATA